MMLESPEIAILFSALILSFAAKRLPRRLIDIGQRFASGLRSARSR
jgi:hypothetical protein